MFRRTGILLGALGVTGLVALATQQSLSRRRVGDPIPIATGSSSAASTHTGARRAERRGGLDATFVVFSDTHLGFDSEETDLLGNVRDPVKDPDDIDRINQKAIRDMNALPGWQWPEGLGGTIAPPRGVLVTGDLTENGEPWQWRHFVLHYGLNGGDGLLAYPVFEAHGNHDKHHSWYVLDRVRERHGGTRYAFDWHDLHLVCLGEAPDDKDLEWVAKDLAEVGRERPIVLYFHFPLRGPYSDNQWFGEGPYRGLLAKTIAGYNVIGLFHGHYHASFRYRWEGFDIYNVGAAKHRRNSFAVVHASDTRLRVASWHFELRVWDWWHEKPINGSTEPEKMGGTREDKGVMPDDHGR